MTALAPASPGITSAEARIRLQRHGENALERERATPPWRIFVAQFASPVIWLLLAAAAIAGLLGEVVDAIAIATILVVNALVGFFQEYRADRAVLALRAMTAPHARVVRDGRPTSIPAAEVVPGDALLLESGDIVAADARLVEAHRLTANEAALTGESLPNDKRVEPAKAEAPIAEQHDRVFAGTSIAAGTGTAEVIATGMQTQLGRIAHMLATTTDSATPLQVRLAKVSKTLMIACLAIVGVVAIVGVLHGQSTFDVFLSAVSLAVAAVPEGLPAVVTIALAIGVQRMASRNVLVRKLHAVETLGCATVICTDKTGTLTTGSMRVRELWGPDHARLIDAAAACCDADVAPDLQGGIGDATEVAILLEAAERGLTRADIERTRPRVEVIPFDPATKMMEIQRVVGAEHRWYVKGAAEALMPLCARGTEGVLEATQQLAGRGLRVLAVAEGASRKDLTFLGLIGIADPPRTEAIDAIAAARSAGIHTVMITGDHVVTARAIASEMGIVRQGESFDDLVHARATPEDKIRIVRDWKSRGDIVAMTGDGVNDAPALREAHVGIAMGKGGTEVTREASDIVLADDNYASIVAGIREGRGVFDNIRKAIEYLLSGNAAELLVMLVAALAGMPLPLLPVQLLWINLVTDGLPALALVMDPTEEDAMQRPPRRPKEPLLGREQWFSIGLTALVQTAVTLGSFAWALANGELDQARDLAFSVLVFGQLFRAFASRSPQRVFWQVGVLGNVLLLVVVFGSAFVQVVIHEVPWTQTLFRVGQISNARIVVAIALGLVPVTVVEVVKLVRARQRPQAS
ncbi:MAG: cation-translocating P-type ATPase [Kofleriaceae bacterium]|nr:cation-translocating P-type ATPase [Kofleriaceae bacterium]